MEQNQIAPPGEDFKEEPSVRNENNVEMGFVGVENVAKNRSSVKMYLVVGITIAVLIVGVAAISSASSSSSSSAGGGEEDEGPFFFEDAEQFDSVCNLAGDVFAFEELPIQFFGSHAFGMCDENNQAHLCRSFVSFGQVTLRQCDVCKCTPFQPIELQFFATANTDQMCSDGDPSVDCLSTDFDFRQFT